MPQISVIIPIYNAQKTLRRCVDSVLKQTLSDFEVILVDDGSSDNSGEICDEYKARDRRVSVIHQENSGVSAARNEGIRKAIGDRIMFLDSDDLLTEDSLEMLSEHDADMIIGSITFTDDGTYRREQKKREDALLRRSQFKAFFPELLEEGRLNYLHGKLYRRQLISEHRLSFENYRLTGAEDTVFNFHYLNYCQSVFILSRSVHHYMFSPAGLARKGFPERYQSFTRLYHILKDDCERMDILTDEMQAALNRKWIIGADAAVRLISSQSGLSYRRKKALLEEICQDKELSEIIAVMDITPFEDLDYLLKKGTRKFLRNRFLMRRLHLTKLYRYLPEGIRRVLN